MSVWADYAAAVPPPLGTPDLRVRRTEQGEYEVLVDGTRGSVHPDYYAAHLWCQNTHRLTSTMMLPIRQEYEASLPPEPESGNKYRKEPVK